MMMLLIMSTSSKQVKRLNELKDSDQFLYSDFTIAEVQKAIDKLHVRKASGYCGDHPYSRYDVRAQFLVATSGCSCSRDLREHT